MADVQVEDWLKQGIAALRAGQKEQARALLMRVVERDERNEAAWLWLSGAVDDASDRQVCLENVLAINPANPAAQAGLRHLTGQRGLAAPSPEHAAQLPPVRAAEPPLEPALDVEPLTWRAQPAEPPLRPDRYVEPAAPVVFPTEPSLAPARPARPPDQAVRPAQPPPQPARPVEPPAGPTQIEFDPYGCPYCGAAVDTDQPRCTSCGRQVELRYRWRSEGLGLIWLTLFVGLQGIAAAGDAYLTWVLGQIRELPAWLSQSAVVLLVGRALFDPGGLPPTLDRLVTAVIAVDAGLGALCLLLGLGLALRSRAAYFATMLVLGLLIVAALTGLLTGLSGPLPALFRVIMAGACLKWLVDSAPAFEWQMRRYNADLDLHLQTAMDYYDQGKRYAEMGMWAKAAAHWKVATQLEGRPELHAALARAYARLGYRAAALAQADTAVRRAPDDEEMRALQALLAEAGDDRG